MIYFKQKQASSKEIAEHDPIDFPRKIGNFVFVKKFFPDKKVRQFYFAIYKDDSGKEAIAKQWNKSCKYIHYHWLMNEINVYKEIHRVLDNNPQISQKYPNAHIPRLLGVLREKSRLIMLIEKIDGQSLKDLSTENQVSFFQTAIEYLALLGERVDLSAKSSLIKRSGWHMMATFLFIIILAVLNHPKRFLSIFYGGIVFVLNIFRILNSKNMTLVHRDLHPDHIITIGNHLWIIDFEISVITNPAFEIAVLRIFLWNDTEFCDQFEKGQAMESIMKDKNKFYSYKILSIYLALYNFGAINRIPSDQVFSYLNYALGLKFLK